MSIECKKLSGFLFLCLFFLGFSVNSSELIYQPINPSFGGSPSNGSFLLNSANAQKQFEDEVDEDSPLQQFNERLQRSLLSRITRVISDGIIGGDGTINPGTFETIDFTVEVVDLGSGIMNITTVDKETGDRTVVEVDTGL